jgi:putative hydrolase of the HAD superfamily
MKEKIKGVIFDVGGVLAIGKRLLKIRGAYHHKGLHEFMAKKFNVSLDQYFDSIDTPYARSIIKEITKKQFLNKVSKNFNTTSKKLEKFYKEAIKRNFKQNKELYNIAFKLKKQGYKIAILSDQWHISKEVLMPEKYTKKFNAVIVSCDVGIRKPNPKIYKLVLKKLKLPAKNTVFIDNQKWNIKPAKKLGMNTILFKNNKQTLKELKKLKVGAK